MVSEMSDLSDSNLLSIAAAATAPFSPIVPHTIHDHSAVLCGAVFDLLQVLGARLASKPRFPDGGSLPDMNAASTSPGANRPRRPAAYETILRLPKAAFLHSAAEILWAVARPDFLERCWFSSRSEAPLSVAAALDRDLTLSHLLAVAARRAR